MTRRAAIEPQDNRTAAERYLTEHLALLFSFVTAIVYYVSNPKPQNYYDYTFRVAGSLLSGRLGLIEQPPSWLNEFVPLGGTFYSVFPLGAVLTMIPAAMLKTVGLIADMPGTLLAAISAGIICWLLIKISAKYDTSLTRSSVMTAGIVFGSFMWTNLTFAGAWQLALGFSMIGELGAIYFTIYDRRPLIAGAFFALAFGNRTENLLTAPILMYLLSLDGNDEMYVEAGSPVEKPKKAKSLKFKFDLKAILRFSAVPLAMGVATLAYNYARFGDLTDFGYARIPGVLVEQWYNHGIFSTQYIPRQAWEMLGKNWEVGPTFPYLLPNGFSSSILISSPFLLLALKPGYRSGAVKLVSWTAVVILTFLLWIHGNSGGWQFGYRYAMVLLPWLFVILLESAPRRLTRLEWVLYALSIGANLYATWLFHWTGYMKVGGG
ncbi:MAG: hypothetical protein ABJA02_16425 [Acidobacteriota bacterium]